MSTSKESEEVGLKMDYKKRVKIMSNDINSNSLKRS